MHWPNLPESYGEGQRQFDMAKAALDAVEPPSYLSAILAFSAGSHYVPLWAAACGAAIAYLAFVQPCKRRLKAARLAWVEDVRAYQQFLGRGREQ